MTTKEKVDLIKQKVKQDFNGIEKISARIDSKGKVSFRYKMVKAIETYPQDIDTIIRDGIKSSQQTIKFLKGLLRD